MGQGETGNKQDSGTPSKPHLNCNTLSIISLLDSHAEPPRRGEREGQRPRCPNWDATRRVRLRGADIAFAAGSFGDRVVLQAFETPGNQL